MFSVEHSADCTVKTGEVDGHRALALRDEFEDDIALLRGKGWKMVPLPTRDLISGIS
jgi:hypothetical protein